MRVLYFLIQRTDEQTKLSAHKLKLNMNFNKQNEGTKK